MKTLYKAIVSLLIFTLFYSASYAAILKDMKRGEKLYDKKYSQEHIYFDDYAKRLYASYNPRKLTWLHECVTTNYTINKDGSAANVEPQWNDTKIPRSYRYGMSVIKNLPPKPFLKGMDDESIKMDVCFCKSTFDRITLDYYPYLDGAPVENVVSIDIFKNFKTKK